MLEDAELLQISCIRMETDIMHPPVSQMTPSQLILFKGQYMTKHRHVIYQTVMLETFYIFSSNSL